MHELYATQAILEKAILKANEANAKRITNLYLVVGEISTYTNELGAVLLGRPQQRNSGRRRNPALPACAN